MKLLPIERMMGGSTRHPHTITTTVINHAKVDDRHFDYLRQFRWLRLTKSRARWYVTRYGGKTRRHILLHEEIMELEGISVTKRVDHIDGDVLNCQASNLRPATDSENGANQKLTKTSTTGFKGVSWHKYVGKYAARITKNRKPVYLGYFNTAEDAARAYDTAALSLHGPFARTNKSLGLIS